MKGFDLFGSQILFRFQGQSSRKTIFGSWFSLLIVVIIGIRLAFIIAEVWERRSPQVIYSERQVNSPAAFEFSNSTARIAFGMQNPSFEHYIDPTIYNLTISQVKKTMVYNSETKMKDSVWETNEFTPDKCTLEYFQGTETEEFFKAQSYNRLYCLSIEDKLVIEGDFSQDIFQYWSISVKRCAGSTCSGETVIDESLKNGYFAVYYTDVIVSPENKTSPFQHYARDNFWIVNQDSPKLVDFYFRNTYIESDFGWVYEDTSTQKFAQFSLADVQYMPQNSVDYNFVMNFRFEKQKENLYKRKYKNINSIISEIGGFSQTMLAVGFILCTRFSQLELNKEIINRAFHFEDTEKTYSKSATDRQQQQQKPQDQYSQHQQQHQQITQSQHFLTNQQNQQMSNSTKQNKSVNFQLNEKQLPSLTTSSVAIQKPQIKKHAIAGIANQMMLGGSGNMYEERGGRQQQPTHQVPDVSNCLSQNLQLSVPGSQFRNQQQQQQQQQQQLQMNQSTMLSPSKLIELPESRSIDQKRESHTLMLSTIIQQKIVGLRAKNEGGGGATTNTETTGTQKEKEITETHFRTLMNKFTGSMTLNVWEYVKFFVWPFGKVKEKKQIIDYSIDKLYYHLDVLNVVKKMLEIDKLKRLIMDEDQLNLFECWPKPLIRSAEALGYPVEQDNLEQQQQSQPSDFLYRDVRSDMEKTQLAYLSYLRIRRKNGLKPLDEKIMKLMDKNLVRLFELNLHDGIPADVLGAADIGHGNGGGEVHHSGDERGDEYYPTMPQVLTSPVNNNNTNHTFLLTNQNNNNNNPKVKFEALGNLIKEEESEMKQQDYADTQRGMLLSPQSSQQLFTRLNEDDVLSYEDKIQIEIPIEEDRNAIKIQMFPNQK